MLKKILILGTSGVGKSHALKSAFDAPLRGYGVKSAVTKNTYLINGYQYLPEITGNVESAITKPVMQAYFDNGNITVFDGCPKVPVYKKWICADTKIILLVGTDDEIRSNLERRKGKTKGKTTLDDKVKDSVAWQKKLLTKGYATMTQNELIIYLKTIIHA